MLFAEFLVRRDEGWDEHPVRMSALSNFHDGSYSILQLASGEVREYGPKSGGLDMFTDRWSALCSSKGTAE